MRFLLFFLFLSSCGSPGGSSTQAARYARSLCQELEQVETADELKERELKIKKLFNNIAQLLIESSRSPDDKQPSPIPPALAHQLREQLERIYRMEEGREIMERAQGEALRWLDRGLPRNSERPRTSPSAP